MTVKNEVDIELWEVIQKNYDTENYTGAILDAIFKLTDTIRNKTGLEGDGASLIGQAFGGDDPRIKLNKLQTDSEKDIQKGIQDILRGIYTGIRNPRSHDSMADDKQSTDAIIIFINYLLRLIDQSKLRFNENDFLKRIFDQYYVKSKEYSDLLVKEIPKRQRANIAIQVILQRNKGDIYALRYFLESLLSQLDNVELSRIYKVVSEELQTTTDYADIRYLLNICPGKYWNNIDEAVRVRTEAILFEDFSNGSYNKITKQCENSGALATWISEEHLSNFRQLEKWTRKAIELLNSENENVVSYIDEFFWSKICRANYSNITPPLKYYFQKGLKNNNEQVISKLKNEICWIKDHPWWDVFKEELKNYRDIKYEEFPF